jgi:hypothetical protein
MVDPTSPAPEHPEPAQNPAVAHESEDVNVRGVLWFAGALFAVGVAVHLVLAWMFFSFRHREDEVKRSQFPLSAPEREPLPQATLGAPFSGELPARPQLEGLDLEGPRHDVGRERRQGTAEVKNEKEEQQLREGDRLPIEQAMKLVAEERKPKGREPRPVRQDQGVPGTGGGSNSGRSLPEARR